MISVFDSQNKRDSIPNSEDMQKIINEYGIHNYYIYYIYILKIYNLTFFVLIKSYYLTDKNLL